MVGEGGGIFVIDRSNGQFLWAHPFPFDTPDFLISNIDGKTGRVFLNKDKLFKGPNDRRVIEKLRAAGVDPVEPQSEAKGPLEGASFVVTGTLSRPREDVIRRIEAAGGKVTGSVSKKTAYLVAGAEVGKAKMDAAQKHGVRVISEAELDAILDGSSRDGAER